jgi:hypothetical protein
MSRLFYRFRILARLWWEDAPPLPTCRLLEDLMVRQQFLSRGFEFPTKEVPYE